MPYADPEREAERNRAWWRANGRAYRQSRPDPRLPPISRSQALSEDLGQARALEALEARRIGRERAAARLAEFTRRERAWLSLTSARYTIGGRDDGEQD